MFSRVSCHRNFHNIFQLRRVETITPTVRVSYHITKVFKRDKIITKTINYSEPGCNIVTKCWYVNNKKYKTEEIKNIVEDNSSFNHEKDNISLFYLDLLQNNTDY